MLIKHVLNNMHHNDNDISYIIMIIIIMIYRNRKRALKTSIGYDQLSWFWRELGSKLPNKFFWVTGERFLSWECRDFEDNMTAHPKIPEDLRKRLKSFEDSGSGNSPDISQFPVSGRVSQGSLVVFISYIGLSLRLLGKLCEAKLQPLTFFSIRPDNLARNWAGVRSKCSIGRRDLGVRVAGKIGERWPKKMKRMGR